jgi:hypothetical protein
VSGRQCFPKLATFSHEFLQSQKADWATISHDPIRLRVFVLFFTPASQNSSLLTVRYRPLLLSAIGHYLMLTESCWKMVIGCDASPQPFNVWVVDPALPFAMYRYAIKSAFSRENAEVG